MQIEGAVIKEQGVSFAVVAVKRHVVESPTQAASVMRTFSPVFHGLPIVLMAQDESGRATYYGRRDLSKFMASVPLQAVRWKRYTIN